MNYYVCYKVGTLPDVSTDANIDICHKCKQLVHVMPRKMLEAETMDASIVCLECIEKIKAEMAENGTEFRSFKRGDNNDWEEADWEGAKKEFGQKIPSKITLDSIIRKYYLSVDGIIGLLPNKRFEILEKILSIPFDPEIHYPILHIHLHFAILEVAKKILDFIPNKEDELYKQLEDLYNALDDCKQRNFTAVFPLNVPYRNWWNGPHLEFHNKGKITDWFPLKIRYIEDKEVAVLVGKKEANEVTFGRVKFPKEKFPENLKEEIYGEIAFYGEDYVIKLHNEIWDQPKELKELCIKTMPYIIKAKNWR